MAKSPPKKRGAGTGRKVRDVKRGKAVDNYQVDVDGEDDDDTIGHNSKHFEPEPRALRDYLATIDEQDAIIAEIMENARKKAQAPRGAKKTARKRMIEDGYHAKELDTLVRKHVLERKVEAIAEKLDDGQREFFAALVKALGPLADTALGQAALERAQGDQSTDKADQTEDEFA